MFNAEINRKLDLITRLLFRLLNLTEAEGKYLMALQPEVQALVDQVTADSNAKTAAQTALKTLADQITALQAQVAAIQPGAPIDTEDLQAIKDAAATLAQTNTAMQTAVPANTAQAPSQPSGSAGSPAT